MKSAENELGLIKTIKYGWQGQRVL